MRADISPDLTRALKTLRLGQLLPTLPERLKIARERQLDPEDLLLTLLTDEIERRGHQRHRLRAREAGLDAGLVFDQWDPSARITFDRRVFDELRLLRFVEEGHHALVIGPVGVGKTMIAHALGHLAVLRNLSVTCATAERIFHDLRAARLDGSHERELRRLSTVRVLIIDDSATIRAVLFSLLSVEHEVVQAKDGVMGLEQARGGRNASYKQMSTVAAYRAASHKRFGDLLGTKMNELVIGFDTSGSCFGGHEMTRFVSEIRTILEDVKPAKTHVIYWDTKVAGHQVFEDGQFAVQSLKPKGGGGTDGSVLFDYLRDKRIAPQAIVQFTDGYVGSWGNSDCPTLWAITTNIRAPYGTTIQIGD
jgi:CheY-like chemotaxis protein